MKNHMIKKAIFFPLIAAAGVFLLSALVMFLWNAVLAQVLHVQVITLLQAAGILLLSKILFGGFWHSRHGWHSRHRRHMWENLSEEEREKMKEEWKRRCSC